jgi:hypothetical protein
VKSKKDRTRKGDQAQTTPAMIGKKVKFSEARRRNLARLIKGSRFHSREKRTSDEPRG